MYGDNVLAINGCGPTVVSIILAGLTGRNDVTPYTVAVFFDQNGYYQNGTKWESFTNGVKEFGIIGKNLSLSKGKMLRELDKGHPIICSMKQRIINLLFMIQIVKREAIDYGIMNKLNHKLKIYGIFKKYRNKNYCQKYYFMIL